MPAGAVMKKRRCWWPSETWVSWPMMASACWKGCRVICCGRRIRAFFAVIFWYFLLGPVAALAYRLLALAAEHGKTPALIERAAQLRHAFDWVPVRLLAASFALVGNFVAVSRVMLHELLNWNISAAQLIAKIGCAASEVPAPVVGVEGVNSLDVIWELLIRAAVVWYAGFALWTLLV